jgi:hypothetical protein
MVLMEMSGMTLVRLRLENGDVTVNTLPNVPVNLEAARILGLVQLARWPESSLGKGLADEVALRPGPHSLAVDREGKSVILIEKRGNCPPCDETIITSIFEKWAISIRDLHQ